MENGQYEIDLGTDANVPPETDASAAAPEKPAPRGRRKRVPRTPVDVATGGKGLMLADAFALLRKALVGLGAVDEQSTDADKTRARMLELAEDEDDPIFDAKRFQRLLRQAHDAGVIELVKADSDVYLLKALPLPGSEDGDEQPKGLAEVEAGSGQDDVAAAKKGARQTKTTTRKAARRPKSRRATKSDAGAEVAGDKAKAQVPAEAEVEAAPAKPASAKKRPARKRATKAARAAAEAGEEKAPPAKRATKRKRTTTTRSRASQPTADAEDGAGQPAPSSAGGATSAQPEGETGAAEGSTAARRYSRFRTGSRGVHKGAPTPPRETSSDEPPAAPLQVSETATEGMAVGRRSVRGRGGSRSHKTPPVTQTHEDQPAASEGTAVPSVDDDASSSVVATPPPNDEPQSSGGLLRRMTEALQKAVLRDSESDKE